MSAVLKAPKQALSATMQEEVAPVEFFLKSFLNMSFFLLTITLASHLPLAEVNAKGMTRREINALLVCVPLAYFIVQLLGSDNKTLSSWAVNCALGLPSVIAAIAGRRFFLWGGVSVLLLASLIALLVLLFHTPLDAPRFKSPTALVILLGALLVNAAMIFYVRLLIGYRRARATSEAPATATVPETTTGAATHLSEDRWQPSAENTEQRHRVVQR